MGGKRLANMGKRRRPTYKNTFSAYLTLLPVREKWFWSGKSQGILISHLCGNPVLLTGINILFICFFTGIILVLENQSMH